MCSHERAIKYFGDIVRIEWIESPRVEIIEDDYDVELLWEVLISRPKSKKVSRKQKKQEKDMLKEYIFEEINYLKIRPSKRLPRKELTEILEFINS